MPAQAGSVVLTWSVAHASTPQACAAVGAATFRVALSSWEGDPAGTWTVDCSAFSATISGLSPDEYTGHAELLDSTGNACVPPLDLVDVTVVGAASEPFALDFASTTSPD